MLKQRFSLSWLGLCLWTNWSDFLALDDYLKEKVKEGSKCICLVNYFGKIFIGKKKTIHIFIVFLNFS